MGLEFWELFGRVGGKALEKWESLRMRIIERRERVLVLVYIRCKYI